jgi:hypothetical protein
MRRKRREKKRGGFAARRLKLVFYGFPCYFDGADDVNKRFQNVNLHGKSSTISTGMGDAFPQRSKELVPLLSMWRTTARALIPLQRQICDRPQAPPSRHSLSLSKTYPARLA